MRSPRINPSIVFPPARDGRSTLPFIQGVTPKSAGASLPKNVGVEIKVISRLGDNLPRAQALVPPRKLHDAAIRHPEQRARPWLPRNDDHRQVERGEPALALLRIRVEDVERNSESPSAASRIAARANRPSADRGSEIRTTKCGARRRASIPSRSSMRRAPIYRTCPRLRPLTDMENVTPPLPGASRQ
jgi:hypothetical protein